MRCLIITNVKIIVIDDNEMLRDFIVDVLTFCVNREVLSFSNGYDALHHISKEGNVVDIVISDINMPKMDGFTLLRNVKQKYPEKIFVAMSGLHENEEKARQLGADAFLAKPFELDDLFNIVQTFIV